MSSIKVAAYIDSDQENSSSSSRMDKKTPQQRKLSYRNLLHKIEGISIYSIIISLMVSYHF